MAMEELDVKGYSAAGLCLLCRCGDSVVSAVSSAAVSGEVVAVVPQSLSETGDRLGLPAGSESGGNFINKHKFLSCQLYYKIYINIKYIFQDSRFKRLYCPFETSH